MASTSCMGSIRVASPSPPSPRRRARGRPPTPGSRRAISTASMAPEPVTSHDDRGPADGLAPALAGHDREHVERERLEVVAVARGVGGAVPAQVRRHDRVPAREPARDGQPGPGVRDRPWTSTTGRAVVAARAPVEVVDPLAADCSCTTIGSGLARRWLRVGAAQGRIGVRSDAVACHAPMRCPCDAAAPARPPPPRPPRRAATGGATCRSRSSSSAPSWAARGVPRPPRERRDRHRRRCRRPSRLSLGGAGDDGWLYGLYEGVPAVE